MSPITENQRIWSSARQSFNFQKIRGILKMNIFSVFKYLPFISKNNKKKIEIKIVLEFILGPQNLILT